MRGFTLVEVMLALAVAALGFAMAAAGIPAALRYATEAEDTAAASAVALRYVSLLESLPADADEAALAGRFRLAFPEVSDPEAVPRTAEVAAGLLYEAPAGPEGCFTDAFTGMRVRLAFAPSIEGPPARCWVVWVRTPGGRWLAFPFARYGR